MIKIKIIDVDEVVSTKDEEVPYADIYPPVDKCPYESTEVWCCRIEECVRPIFEAIMKSRVVIDWAEIENEVVAEYISTTPYETTETVEYAEKYIQHRFIKVEKETYESHIEAIDSVIDSIFTNTTDNSKYVYGGRLLKAKLINDVARQSIEDGIFIWLPSYTAYIEAVLDLRETANS